VLFGVVLVSTLVCGAPPAGADPVRDTLPYRVAFGHPHYTSGERTACYLWIEGGRLHLRISADRVPHKVEGELRTSDAGVFEDVTPLSERLRPRQPRPAKLMFDAVVEQDEEGFDVTLSGDFTYLTVDLLVDGERVPAELNIGERAEHPLALPARLRLRGSGSDWLTRFGRME
jgi:hypothetical protein